VDLLDSCNIKLGANHLTGLLMIYASSIYLVSTMMYTLWSSL